MPRRLVGQAALHRELALQVPAPSITSYVAPAARYTQVWPDRVQETYPPRYDPGPSIIDQLRFALSHEPLDLGVLAATFAVINGEEIRKWVLDEPAGGASRRAWFLYETLTGRQLDAAPKRRTRYVDALAADKQYTSASRKSPRHLVNDNLLGGRLLSPTVRRTSLLDQATAAHLGARAQSLVLPHDEKTLARAVSYLYTKETRSSFLIEGETPVRNKEERFIAALRDALRFDPTREESFVALHSVIVDQRYAASGWRATQNFVGQTLPGYREQVDFVPPKPEDVAALMSGWTEMVSRLLESDLDPVVAAAVAAFAFVFIHPFEDGNGRIHRFLVHCVLAHKGFAPPGMIFPVSAAILRDRHAYDAALESYSARIMPFVEWRFDADERLLVQNDTAHLYRYFDATVHAQYLYDRVRDTIERDLPEELSFVARYDAALRVVAGVVDMPDRRASLVARLVLQNDGRFPRTRYQDFAELTGAEIASIEAGIQRVIERQPAPAT